MEEYPAVHQRLELHQTQSTTALSVDYLELNATNNTTNELTSLDEQIKIRNLLYKYIVPFLTLFCITSILINVWILSSVYWIQRKLSRTLLISLSLAGADVFASLTVGLGLVINSLMGTALEFRINDCFALVLEAFRLSAIITTVVHLLALAGNHYLGILRPLHYASIMTHRMTTLCIVLLWLFPFSFMFSYFSLVDQQGFSSTNCVNDFLGYSKFRLTFATLIFVPFLVMLVIYSHIFIIVRHHQSVREVLLRESSVRPRRNQRNNHSSGTMQQNTQQQMAKNVKAIYTTMFILGSFFMGWMPALLVYLLMCHDCVYPINFGHKVVMFGVHSFANFLIILKTLLNPIIYAARMHEIKVAMRRMHFSIRRVCCPYLPPNPNDGVIETSQSDLSRHHTQRTSTFNSSTRGASATVCRVKSLPLVETPLTSSNGSFEDIKLSLLQRSTKRSFRRRQEEHSAVL
ncbi:glucose-dependent insulinotropic receptor-like [Anabrus simplex]|uniref:glucose-dependent insulinotropic receptor-like n=1 Tax=Anabrus simplex TaxID=316456 RepID=UPI0035A2B78C